MKVKIYACQYISTSFYKKPILFLLFAIFYFLNYQVIKAQCPGSFPECYSALDCANLADKDGDGVPDQFDLDDDNDGIPDVDEGLSNLSIPLLNGTNSQNSTTTVNTQNASGCSAVTLTSNEFSFDVGWNNGTCGPINTTSTFSIIINGTTYLILTSPSDGSSNADNATDQGGDVFIQSLNGATFINTVPSSQGNAYLDPSPFNNWTYSTIVVNIPENIVGTDVTFDIEFNCDDYSFQNVVVLYACATDTDNDGIPDHLDLDSDNDGIPDAIEACGNTNLSLENCSLDTDGSSTYDTDANDCSTGVITGSGCTTLKDSDNDGIPDYLDLDSDGDGCADATEAGTDGSGTSTDTYVAGSVDDCGLLTTGISGNCAVPSTTDWITEDLCINACTSGPDKDGDGLPDQYDLDDDNDGILDAVELEFCSESTLEWKHNDDNGQSDYATYGDPSHAANYSNTSLATFGSGLDETTDNYAFTYLLRGADQTTYIAAKNNNDYVELAFTPSVDHLLFGLNFGFYTNNTSVPDFNCGNFKIAVEYSTLSNFSTFTKILEDVQVGAMNGGGYVSIQNSLSGITLLSGTTYYYRFYFYDEQNADPDNRVRFDDIFFQSVILNGCEDTDGDGIINSLDLDSDNDGIPDAIEACGNISLTLENCSLDADGSITYDVDANGCSTGVVTGSGCTTLLDTDMDGTPDYLDLDSDGDGCADATEAITDQYGTNTTNFAVVTVNECGLIDPGVLNNCPVPIDDTWLIDDQGTMTCPTTSLFIEGCSTADITTANSTFGFTATEVDITANVTTNLAVGATIIVTPGVEFTTPFDIYCIGQNTNFDVDCNIKITYIDVIGNTNLCPNAITVDRTYTLTTPCGEMECTQNIVISDETTPIITTCPPAIGPIEGCTTADIVTASGFAFSDADATITAQEFIDAGGVVTEACGVQSVTYIDEITDETCPNPILVITRTWSVTDNCDNTSETCTQTITLQDDTAPTITFPATLSLACTAAIPSGATTTAQFVNAGGTITDDCSTTFTVSFVDLITTESCDERVVERTYTVTDDCGNNSSSFIQVITIGDGCTPTELYGDICTYLTNNPDSQLGIRDCDLGGVDNATECDTDGTDPENPCDDDGLTDEYLCNLVENDPFGVGLLDCDGDGNSNFEECGSDNTNSIDPCDDIDLTGPEICMDIANAELAGDITTSIYYGLDCDNGGITNEIECANGGDPFDESDECLTAIAADVDICELIINNTAAGLTDLDCDGGGETNLQECLGPDGDPNTGDETDPTDPCDDPTLTATELCALVAADPMGLGAEDCDGGGDSNFVECEGPDGDPSTPDGNDPTDPCDDENLTAEILCALVAADPNGIGSEDCDGGGETNFEECEGPDGDPSTPDGDDPTDPCDDPSLDAATLCVLVAADPDGIGAQDCDGGGETNLEECLGDDGDPSTPDGTNPLNPCDDPTLTGDELCALVAADPTIGLLDCDGGGETNTEECNGPDGDPSTPDGSDPTDPCDDPTLTPEELCALVAADPFGIGVQDCDGGGETNTEECLGDDNDPSTPDGTNPLDPCDDPTLSGEDLCVLVAADPDGIGALDCDGGGVSNLDECNGPDGDPETDDGTDPTDETDECEAAEIAGLDICEILLANPNVALANLDCDNGGETNIIECNGPDGDPNTPDGTDPNEPCDDPNVTTAEFCALVTADPDGLGVLDCDGGGVNNLTECSSGTDPKDESDECEATEAYTGGICQYLADNQGSILGTLDCDGGGVDNQTECNSNDDPTEPTDDCDAAADSPGGICGYLANNPNSPLADDDCDGGGIDNTTECNNGGNPNDEQDDSCNSFTGTGLQLCELLAGLPVNHPLAIADCDMGGITNIEECNNGSDPLDSIDDDCDEIDANNIDICEYLAQNPDSAVGALDCDNGGDSNTDECNAGSNPNDPADDDCSQYLNNGIVLCDFISQFPNNPIAAEDCDGGGVDNATECENGGDPGDPVDDSCEQFEASGMDLCVYLAQNPNSPLATEDCDMGGVNNITECDSQSGDPDDETDDCDAAAAYNGGICAYLADFPNSGLAALDCDGGGEINSIECTNGGDPSNPVDDSCENFEASNMDLCMYLTQNPNSPLAMADCDGGGVNNSTECGNGGNPFNEQDDSCDSFTGTGNDLCILLDALPATHPLALADCDMGGVNNTIECDAGGDPTDPIDDSCDSFSSSTLDLCAYITLNPNTPLATEDCDGGGAANATECENGGDPTNEQDDSCDSFTGTGEELCAIVLSLPLDHPLAVADCDGGGISNIIECKANGNPNDENDDSCDSFDFANLDLCEYLNANPGSVLEIQDCDGGGVSNFDECMIGGNPNDGSDDSCTSFAQSGLDLCTYINNNPNSPLATQDCDLGGVDNVTECANGTDPTFQPDDNCDAVNNSSLNICIYLSQNPNSPLADLDCDGGGLSNGEECSGGNDPRDSGDDTCDFEMNNGGSLCSFLHLNPNSALGSLDCDGGGVDNLTECVAGTDPYFGPDDSCESFAVSDLNLCTYISNNPNSYLANEDCDGGGVSNQIECDAGGNPNLPFDDSCTAANNSNFDICVYLALNANSPLANLDCDNGGIDNITECANNDDPFNANDDCITVCDDNNACTTDILNEENCTCEYVLSCSNDSEGPTIIPDFGVGIYNGAQYAMYCDNFDALTESSVTVTDNCDDAPTVTFVDEFVSYGECATDGYLSKWRCYWIAEDACGNQTIFEIFVTMVCSPCDDNNACTYDTYDGCDCVHEQIPNCGYQTGYCTFPQDFYGGETPNYGGSTYIDVLNSSFANCGGYISVGLPGQSLTVADIACLDALLPAYGGVALCQPGNAIYSGLCSYTAPLGNSLIGELIVLNLNVAYDYNLETVSLCNPNNCVYAPQSIRNLLGYNCTVAGLIDLANNALGGLHGNDLNLLNDILITIRLINDGYSYCGDACVFNREIQEIILKEVTQETVVVSQPVEEQQLAVDEQNQEQEEEVTLIEQTQKIEFSVYPNPAEQLAEMQINLPYDVNNGIIKIHQLNGKILFKENFSGKKGFKTNTIDISDLPVGMYFISIEFENEIYLQKLTKI